MAKCLDALNSYEIYSTRIFRKDYHYAKVLLQAITAASEVYDQGRYAEEASRYASRIISNCDQEDWALRYFAAETFVDLAGKTSDQTYLQQAYDIALNNVNYLARKQLALNQEYTAKFVPVEIPADATESKKAEIEAFNKGQQEARKVAVPPVSEAFILNCDLLFSLAEHLEVDEAELEKVRGILYGNGDALFLNPVLNSLYSFGTKTDIIPAAIEVSFDGKEIKLPAKYVTEGTIISVGLLDAHGQTYKIENWTIKAVDRKEESDIDSFTAVLSSPAASSFSYSDGSTAWINFNSYGDDHTPDMQFFFKVASKTDFLIPRLTFQRIEQ